MKLICDHAQVCTLKTCYHQDIHDEFNRCDNYTYFYKGSEVTCKPIKEDEQMEYVLGKNLISRKSVYDTLPKNCKEALEIYENFEHRFKFSLGFDEAIPLGSVIDFLKDKPQKVTDWFVEKGFLAKKLEETYSIGDRFMKEGALNEYILGVIDFNTVALINLTTGNRYSASVVNNTRRITEEELAKITPYAKFTRVHKRK
uniref:Uncharacterized protein n=1 Tax=viral metagenome TaxID=1070528 RepID=A0A6M3K734_9ZZZZ